MPERDCGDTECHSHQLTTGGLRRRRSSSTTTDQRKLRSEGKQGHARKLRVPQTVEPQPRLKIATPTTHPSALPNTSDFAGASAAFEPSRR